MTFLSCKRRDECPLRPLAGLFIALLDSGFFPTLRRSNTEPPSCLEIPSQMAGSRADAALRSCRIERLALGAEFRHRKALVYRPLRLAPNGTGDKECRLLSLVRPVILSEHPSPLIISIFFQISVRKKQNQTTRKHRIFKKTNNSLLV